MLKFSELSCRLQVELFLKTLFLKETHKITNKNPERSKSLLIRCSPESSIQEKTFQGHLDNNYEYTEAYIRMPFGSRVYYVRKSDYSRFLRFKLLIAVRCVLPRY